MRKAVITVSRSHPFRGLKRSYSPNIDLWIFATLVGLLGLHGQCGEASWARRILSSYTMDAITGTVGRPSS